MNRASRGALPQLFNASAIDDLFFPYQQGTVFRAVSGVLQPAGELPRGSRLAYRDPSRGIVLVGFQGRTLIRQTWGGDEFERFDVQLAERSMASAAFDPHRQQLVIAGGQGGAPWGLSVLPGSHGEIAPFSSAAFDPVARRLVSVIDFISTPRSLSSAPARFGWIDGQTWHPLAAFGGELWSKLAYDAELGGVVAFAQQRSGADVLLYALREEGFLPALPRLEAPPMKSFRLSRAEGELVAFGGQVFGGAPDQPFRFRGGRWVQG